MVKLRPKKNIFKLEDIQLNFLEKIIFWLLISFIAMKNTMHNMGKKLIINLTMFGKIYPLVELCGTNVVEVNNQLYCLDLKGRDHCYYSASETQY